MQNMQNLFIELGPVAFLLRLLCRPKFVFLLFEVISP
jgi:hypothetical protein